MTKEEVRAALEAGSVLGELFVFSEGQECYIFKAPVFEAGAEILYIPDTYLNELPITEEPTCEDEIDRIIDCCYTGDDFIKSCDGDVELAKRLFAYCDWQHPSSALPEVDDDEEEDEQGEQEDAPVARKLDGTVYRVRTTTGGVLVEVPYGPDEFGALCRFCAAYAMKGYVITSVTRIEPDSNSQPRVPVFSQKEYRTELKRLKAERSR